MIGRCLFFLQSCRTSNYVRSVAMSWFQSDVCVMERLRKKILFKLSVRVEVSSVESNETTAATVSCDLAPPPQRRRRRHPPPPPPRNLPFVTLSVRSMLLTADMGELGDGVFVKADSHLHARHDTDRTVLSCLAWRCELQCT